MKPQDVIIVIPAYNEAKAIHTVVAAVKKAGFLSVVVIDDNSSDRTSQVARKSGAVVIRHAINLGVGGSSLTGIKHALTTNSRAIVLMDADGQHDPDNIVTLIAPLAHGIDVVLGIRDYTDPAMPVDKKFGNVIMNLVTWILCGIRVKDSQCGFKAITAQAARKMELNGLGYEFHSEIISEIRSKRLRYQEVPIRTIYSDYSKSRGQLALNAVNIITGLIKKKVL